MRAILAAMTLAAGISVCWQSASAVPISATNLKYPATAASLLQQAQYREGYTRHGIVKCYRTLIFGRYRCHYYHRHWW